MNFWLRALVLSAVSLFLFLGIAIGVDVWQFRGASQPGTAEILSLRKETRAIGGNGDRNQRITSYYPTVRYATSKGDYFEAETGEALPQPVPAVGQRIAIRYVTGREAQVRLDRGALREWSIAGSIIAVSLFFLLVTMKFTRRDILEI